MKKVYATKKTIMVRKQKPRAESVTTSAAYTKYIVPWVLWKDIIKQIIEINRRSKFLKRINTNINSRKIIIKKWPPIKIVRRDNFDIVKFAMSAPTNPAAPMK